MHPGSLSGEEKERREERGREGRKGRRETKMSTVNLITEPSTVHTAMEKSYQL